MTATDPRPGLAAALASAYAEDMSAEPPPEDDRAFAQRHRAGRAALSHLRQFLSVLDRAGARLPEPEPAPAGEPADAPDDRVAEPEPGSGYDGSEDEYNFGELRRATICRQADDADVQGPAHTRGTPASRSQGRGSGRGGQRVDSFMPEPATEYALCAYRT